MLVPLTRTTFETLIPSVATGAQYAHAAGKVRDFLRRLLISVVGIVILLLIGTLLGLEDVGVVRLLLGIAAGLYWLWGPVFWASIKNFKYRRFAYTGLWRGEVWDVYTTEELVGQEETVNNRGELVIVDNRERRLNLEVGDESGFSTVLQVPLKKEHQAIARGDRAEMVVLSARPDLSRITATTDIYIPDCNVWVSDYPFLQREAFIEVSRRLEESDRDDAEGANVDRPRAGRSGANRSGANRSGANRPDFDRPSRSKRQSRYATPRDAEDRAPEVRSGRRSRTDGGARNARNDDYWNDDVRDRNEYGDPARDSARDSAGRPEGNRRRPRVDEYFPDRSGRNSGKARGQSGEKPGNGPSGSRPRGDRPFNP